MKKLICIVLSVVMLIALAACTDSGAPTKESYDSQVQNEDMEAEKTTFALNETANFDGLKITAVEMQETKGKDFFTAEDGNVFVGVKFLVENETDEEVSVSSLLMFEAYADDYSCDYSITGVTTFGDSVDGTVAPGKKLQGWYAVEVSEDWSAIEMEVTPGLLSKDSATFVFNK